MRRLALVCLACGGCSLLFDPSGIVPAQKDGGAADLRVPVDDLDASEDLAHEDLTAPPDLSSPPPDLFAPDLLPCVRPRFAGFFDGGSPDPLDCDACGCDLDPLVDADSIALKLNHSANTGWSESVGDGGLTLSASAAANATGDVYNSSGRFYLDGDFDLLIDFELSQYPVGGSLLLYALGPQADGGFGFRPFAAAQEYQAAGPEGRIRLYADDLFLDVPTSQAAGTLRVRRVGTRVCAAVVGEHEQCESGTSSARVWMQIYALVSNASCSSVCTGAACCSFSARLWNLRLERGRVVSAP